ncbi:MAG: protein translocase subunit SecD [Candidatus Marinimicrobia bacterium]|jgi:preprotein translocase subunit SecD|nr:protein translocase subunit SecD [Candidatus Neomarinimicrobiota bacterium]MDP6499096.1 protein translocase subunit SecD [Candidatus Neomarinimicrobiota bacterium]MDP6727003.1 protein translocase subunit SecD [Candidatus Neomarinimicrobiota bacterium]|tara:strand:- start:8257 stop:10179 length:1923 start_codon:yes stop_codon:yes gene_type:complete
MKSKLTPRYIIIALVLVWAFYAIWPTIQYQNLSADEIETMQEEGSLQDLESKIIKQGLDLKGGIYIVLEVDLPTLVSNLAINKDKRFEQALAKISIRIKADSELDFFQVFQDEINSEGLRIHRYFDVDYGGNMDEIVASLKDQADDAINRVLEILQNRVDQFGVSEPTIQKQGNSRIIVELAGIHDSERARDLLQSTALLEFILVKSPDLTNDMLLRIDKVIKGSEELVGLTKTAEEEKTTIGSSAPVSEDKTISVSELFGEQAAQAAADTSDTSVVVDQNLLEDRPFSSLLRALGNDIGTPEKNVYIIKKILAMDDVQDKLDAANGQFLMSDAPESFTNIDGGQEKMYRMFYLEGESELTGGVVEKASATIGGTGSSASGQSIVLLDMNSEGSRTWSRVTGGNIGRRVALVLDKKVHMAPVIRSKISDGGTMIEGFANMDEAKDIAIVLRAGALPAPVNIIEERVVGPSLGADSVAKGTLSVIIGLVLVLIFMLLYYKLSGLIADFALIWNIILVLAILAMLDATLTLPGIAALILTVGMSIDANVIIFERIREEQRKGKTPRAAIDAGYDRALTTIIDANVTTLVAALVLYQFGTGPIRGFATVLFWGIVISMFTAIFVTRTIFNTLTERRGLQRLSI